MWVEPGLGGPGWSEELGGSAGRQLVEPNASLRLAQGLGAHRRGQCSWEKPPPGLHLGTTPLPGAFHTSTGDAGVLERGQGPRLSKYRLDRRVPSGIAGKVQVEPQAGGPGNAHREGLKQRPAGARVPASPSQKSLRSFLSEPETQARTEVLPLGRGRRGPD